MIGPEPAYRIAASGEATLVNTPPGPLLLTWINFDPSMDK